MKIEERKDLDFHIKADLGFERGNGSRWKERWEGEDFYFIEFSQFEYRYITAWFMLRKKEKTKCGRFNKLITIEKMRLGERNSDDFADRAEAFAKKCGF